MLTSPFFNRNAVIVAQELIGKVIQHKYKNIWLKAQVIETEAYLKEEKASHSSLGYTEKRKALFMPPGTIYMYYSRGKDTFNISVGDEGDAVLIKAGVPFIEDETDSKMIEVMKNLNPLTDQIRETHKLCSGQTLLTKSLNLKVPDWDQKQFHKDSLLIKHIDYIPTKIIQTTRLGIPKGRDEHLMYRFVDYEHADKCTKNPLTKNKIEGKDYYIH
ncbi:DNA-3-methyladenine glycosylase [Patescibacteria group bacterium]|nr:DNA-3-methyladenine glycosylase [Patescibacteria group bacterium]